MKVMTQDYQVELVFYAGSSLLEGPLWDDENDLLYFISIEDKFIHSFDEETTEVKSYPAESLVGAAVLDGEGHIISAEQNGIYEVDIESGERTFLIHPETRARMRYNDGKLDPRGRFLVGTMDYKEEIEGEANLFVIEDGQYKELLSDLTLSNGMGWTKNGETFFHVDTPTDIVMKYDYDLEKSELSNGQIIVEIPGDGSPDGMCVDIDDNIWVAEFGGKRVCKWDSETGEQLAEIPMPASNVSSCNLGGPNKDYLYITTAKKEGEPLSGGLFKVKIR